MVTPALVKQKAQALNAIMEAFEHYYLEVLEIGHSDMDEREINLRDNGCNAFYLIREMLSNLTAIMDELAGHMEVCNAIAAINKNKQGGK